MVRKPVYCLRYASEADLVHKKQPSLPLYSKKWIGLRRHHFHRVCHFLVVGIDRFNYNNVFNKVTFNISYNKQLCRLADDFYYAMKDDDRFRKGDDDKTLRLRAIEIAKDIILRNMRGDG